MESTLYTYDLYSKYKLEVRGYYFQFNSNVLKHYMRNIFGDYTELMRSANDFDSLELYINYHISNKNIQYFLEKMLNEANKKDIKGSNINIIYKCLLVRLGNIYTGVRAEKEILEYLNNLAPYITCEKTRDEIDMNYKVDGIITIKGIGEIAIQIKPFSFKSYNTGEETKYHRMFEEAFNIPVKYVLYKQDKKLLFLDEVFEYNDQEKLVEKIEEFMVYFY